MVCLVTTPSRTPSTIQSPFTQKTRSITLNQDNKVYTYRTTVRALFFLLPHSQGRSDFKVNRVTARNRDIDAILSSGRSFVGI